MLEAQEEAWATNNEQFEYFKAAMDEGNAIITSSKMFGSIIPAFFPCKQVADFAIAQYVSLSQVTLSFGLSVLD